MNPQCPPSREVLGHFEAVRRAYAGSVRVGSDCEGQPSAGIRGLTVDPKLETALPGWRDIGRFQLFGLAAGVLAGGVLESGKIVKDQRLRRGPLP